MNTETMIVQLKALADPTRLHIVSFLAGCCCRQCTVQENGDVEGPTAGEVCCHITGADRITSTVSHHLHELENAGFIRMERKGKAFICSLRPEGLTDLSYKLNQIASGQMSSASCCSDACCNEGASCC